MPTNLPPQYYEVEKRYKEARDPAEKIAALEELLGTIPKHKGTDKLRADLRHRLSKLRTSAQTKKGGGRQESAYHIDKEGAGRVVLLGPPNVGKSALVAALTRATPTVSEQPFTTWTPTPGMLEVKNIQIQLMDTPALVREHMEPEMLDLIRSADLLLLVVDLQAAPEEQLQEAVGVLREHRVAPDCLRGELPEDDGIFYMPALVAVNKSDEESLDEDFEILRELTADVWSMLPLSAETGRNLERLKQTVVEELALMRVYAKPPGKDPDMTRPFVLKEGSTVEEFAAKVHQDFVASLKNVRIWGTDVYEGQMVGRDHVLHDEDVVELHM